jgi:hypothetical protein
MSEKRKKAAKIEHSFATYKTEFGNECKIWKVAEALLDWGEIPKTLNDTRAMELSILAKDYLRLSKTRDGKLP